MDRVRTNSELDAAVNTGIAAILMFGLQEGIKVMKANKVPVHIAARIVKSPNLRRSTDWKQ